jgi:copper chaperone CopZ
MMQTERFEVTGMTCGGCSSKVSAALKAVPGVDGVDVSLADHAARVSFDTKATSLGQLESAVRSAGYGVGAAGVKQTAQTKGCCCG